MNQIKKYVVLAFIYLFPVGVLIMLSANWGVLNQMLQSKFLNVIMGAFLLAWVIAGVLFFGLLLFSKQTRELVLAKLANIQERDEREEQIVGRASKQTFLFMLAVLLALFAMSTIRYGEGIHDANHQQFQNLTIGHWGLLESNLDVTTQFDGTKTEEVSLHELLPISKTGLLLFLIALTVVAYHVSANRSLGEKKWPFVVTLFLGLILLVALTVKPQYVTWAEFPSLLVRAEKGDAESQNKVGEMLLFGEGVKQDFPDAMKWFLKSSEQGNAVAPNHIGRLYLNGEGVIRNAQEACKWYRLSAERGDSAGKQNADSCSRRP
jgi:drug/metabolite transporter (DMT)-like permease